MLVDAYIPSSEGIHIEKVVGDLPRAPYLFIHRPLIRIIPWHASDQPRQIKILHNKRIAGRNMPVYINPNVGIICGK